MEHPLVNHALLDLVGGKRVQAAADRVELDEVQVVAPGPKTRRGVQAAVEHPLVNHADRALGLHQMRHGILSEHRKPKARDELGQGVVDLGVGMVGAPGQHDAVPAVVLVPLHGALAHGLDLAMEAGIPTSR